MTTTARPSNGTTLKVDISDVDTVIGLLDTLTPPSATVRNERVDPLDDTKTTAVATGGLENETSEFAVYLDLLDTTHSYLLQITNDPDHADFGDEKTWTVTLPITGIDPWIFTGLLESFSVSIEKGALQKGTGTIQVNESTQLPLPTA